jgi:hypothetical protein
LEPELPFFTDRVLTEMDLNNFFKVVQGVLFFNVNPVCFMLPPSFIFVIVFFIFCQSLFIKSHLPILGVDHLYEAGWEPDTVNLYQAEKLEHLCEPEGLSLLQITFKSCEDVAELEIALHLDVRGGVFNEVQLIFCGTGCGWMQQHCKYLAVSLPHGV